jgi:hypothetical protein
MANKTLMSKIAILLFLSGILAASCKQPTEESEPTYTLWTNSTTYSDFSVTVTPNLDNGYFIRQEISTADFNQSFRSHLNDNYKHEWTESQIYDYLIGRGFDNAQANAQKAWLITVNHGFIASRTGEIVDMLLK